MFKIFRIWWGGLEEVWQPGPGYSWNYRIFRLKEAFGLIPPENIPLDQPDPKENPVEESWDQYVKSKDGQA